MLCAFSWFKHELQTIKWSNRQQMYLIFITFSYNNSMCLKNYQEICALFCAQYDIFASCQLLMSDEYAVFSSQNTCSARYFIWSKPIINVTVYDILYRRSVDIIDNTFNLMLLALLVYFAMLFCLQGFLLVNVSWWTREESYPFTII